MRLYNLDYPAVDKKSGIAELFECYHEEGISQAVTELEFRSVCSNNLGHGSQINFFVSHPYHHSVRKNETKCIVYFGQIQFFFIQRTEKPISLGRPYVGQYLPQLLINE